MTDTDTADQVKRLRIKSDMLRMGEPIAFGSDADALGSAADTIERLTKERDDARAAALEEAADHLDKLAKNTPIGHENNQRGASTYNWLRSHADLIRALKEPT